MAENNIQIAIPIQASQAALITAVSNAFATASGLSADANGVFWVDAAKTIGVKVKAQSSAQAAFYMVDYAGTETQICSSYTGNYSVENCLIYNTSSQKNVLAWGICANTATSKLLECAIAKDELGITRIIGTQSNTIKIGSPNTSAFSKNIPLTIKDAALDFVSMVKLPTIVSRSTFKELYYIFSTPNITVGTDSSIYVGGSLYKIIGNNYGLLAFKV